MARPPKKTQASNGGANLGFEAKLWAAADKLRGNMEPSDYKYVALGLILLPCISDAFEARKSTLNSGSQVCSAALLSVAHHSLPTELQ